MEVHRKCEDATQTHSVWQLPRKDSARHTGICDFPHVPECQLKLLLYSWLPVKLGLQKTYGDYV